MGYTIRTRQYRYTEWVNENNNKIEATELYDHNTDPGENKNIAVLSSTLEIRQKLSKQLRQGWQKALPSIKKKDGK